MNFSRVYWIHFTVLLTVATGLLTAQDTLIPIPEPTEDSSEAEEATVCPMNGQICPTDSWGVWDDIYFYSGPICEDDGTGTGHCNEYYIYFLTAELELELGNGCNDCNVNNPPEESLLVTTKAGKKKKIGPRKPGGLPGVGVNKRSTFLRPPGDISVTYDEVVKLQATGAPARFFRVLRIEMKGIKGTPLSQNHVRWIGQEVEGGDSDHPGAYQAHAWGTHSNNPYKATILFKPTAADSAVAAEVLGVSPIQPMQF